MITLNEYFWLYMNEIHSWQLSCIHIGGSDMSLQPAVHLVIIYWHGILIQTMDCQSGRNIVYVAMTQVYSRAVMQQCTRYYIILLSLCFLHQCLHFIHVLVTVDLTILCTCPIMHDKLITYC